MKPNLYDISWKVDEPTYREDKSLSYSTLARYSREGFNRLDKLFDQIDTPSLTFGSAVDALITGGEEEFNANFIVADFPNISDNLQAIAKTLFARFGSDYRNITDIDDDIIADVGKECDFWANDKYRNYRVKLIKEGCQEYYNLMYAALGKKILSIKTRDEVLNTVKVLKEDLATKFYFADNNPFTDIERFYQLKFKATLQGVDYRCMADLIIVNHKDKTIQPVDLKTSSHTEWDFFSSFIQWCYHIQARLYWRIILDNIQRHPEFRYYTLLPYKFIVVNKYTLTPLVWDYEDTCTYGTLYYGKNKQIECRDPFDLGKELHYYLKVHPNVPRGINVNGSNSLTKWLNTV